MQIHPSFFLHLSLLVFLWLRCLQVAELELVLPGARASQGRLARTGRQRRGG